MSYHRPTVRLSMLLACVALAKGCGNGDSPIEPPPDPPRPTTVAVTPATTALTALGETVQLTAEVLDQNGRALTGTTVAWMSDNAQVATVGSSGLVTAAGNGTATITASGSGVSGTATVTVAQRVSAVAVAAAVDTLVQGDTLRLTAEATDANGRAVPGAEFDWASGDTAVALVDATGLVTAVGAGEVEISATTSQVVGRATLAVVAPAPTTVAITPDTVRLVALGDTVRLAAEVRDQLGRVMDDESVEWASDDTLVSTIDSTGLVVAAGNGTVTITATAGSPTGTATVVVEQEAVALQLTPEAVAFRALGDTLRLVAEAADANGHPVDVVKWLSNDTAVAAVDAAGLVTAVSNGTAAITASAGRVSRSAAVSVEQEVVALGGLPAVDTLLWYGEPGDTLRLMAEAVDANGNRVEDSELEVVWSSSHTGIAMVDADGLVRGIGEGVATITASAETLRATTELTVVNRDRAALVAIYYALGGEDWERNANWLTDPRMVRWQGVTVDLREDGVVVVTELSLFGNNLTGTIPPELWTLTGLRRLVLSGSVGGTLPPEIGNLTQLRALHLLFDSLSGPIPPEIGNLKRLERLWLVDGNLSGTIPPELGALGSLSSLSISRTRLRGVIPPELGNLENLTRLWLGNNHLTGPIPPELGGLDSLTSLHLNGNALTGPIPPALGDLAKLEYLSLGHNALTGMIPSDLGRLVGLRSLGLADNLLTGPIPSELRGLTKLGRLSLDRNALTGAIPTWLGTFDNLTGLSLHDNRLAGPIPAELANLDSLRTLDLGENRLTGSIPAGLARLTHLRSLNIGSNMLTGPVPSWLGGLARLGRLDFHDNQLTGPVPPELGQLNALWRLHLDGNAFTGRIPDTFLQLGDLLGFRWLQTIPPGDLCVPDTAAFRTWLGEIEETVGPLCVGATGGAMSHRQPAIRSPT